MEKVSEVFPAMFVLCDIIGINPNKNFINLHKNLKKQTNETSKKIVCTNFNKKEGKILFTIFYN